MAGFFRRRAGGMRSVVALMLLLTGCDERSQTNAPAAEPQLSDDAPFKYHGMTLRFPKGSVDSRIEEGRGLGPWARLIPDAPASHDAIDARYYIDLGRSYTGEKGPSGYKLGYDFYPPNALRMDLGDAYTLYCQPPERRTPAFNCAALLRSMPFAVIQFRDQPSSANLARELVDDAEAYLTRAKGA